MLTLLSKDVLFGFGFLILCKRVSHVYFLIFFGLLYNFFLCFFILKNIYIFFLNQVETWNVQISEPWSSIDLRIFVLFTFYFLESFLLLKFFFSCIEKKTKTILTSICLFLSFFPCEKDARNTKLTQF